MTQAARSRTGASKPPFSFMAGAAAGWQYVPPHTMSWGSSMKAFLGLGKLVTLVFWGAVLVNLLHPFAYPLNWLLSIAGGLILLIHLIEILVLGGRLKARAHPWLDRLQVLLFGVFHMLALPALSPASELPQDKEDDHA